MPEGHTIHRAARDHRKILAGQKLSVSSPQGRFSDGASLVTGQFCLTVEAFGKHLIYSFIDGHALHIHLGLFGRIHKHKLPIRNPKGVVRVRLVSKTHVVDINGPTICRILDKEGVIELVSRIGPDVLRADAKPDLAFNRIAKSNAPIGGLIMDQSVMAGIGNIYRSEILWRQAIHPKTPGKKIDQKTFNQIWADAVMLLKAGVEKNAIITVDNARLSKGKFSERVNIFGKDKCPICKGKINCLDIGGRRAFVCEVCQPLRG